jgi:hypothetical protein
MKSRYFFLAILVLFALAFIFGLAQHNCTEFLNC